MTSENITLNKFNFENINPDIYTEDDITKLINLWTEYDKNVKELEKIVNNINETSKLNKSIDDEIKVINDDYNKKEEKDNIPLDSTHKIVNLKELNDLLIQKDNIETEISLYNYDLKKLIKEVNHIINEINNLNKDLQTRLDSPEKSPEYYTKICDINLQKISNISDDIKSTNAIISTKKIAKVLIKNTFEENIYNKYKIDEESLVNLINNSEFIKKTSKEYSNNIQKKILDERNKNHIISLEATRTC